MRSYRLGISVGLLGAAIYFLGLFSGYIIMVILAGYVLLFEENVWLKKSAVKAVTLMILFSLLSVMINLIPNSISFFDDFVGIFGGKIQIHAVSKLADALSDVLDLVKKLLFIGLGFSALNQGTVRVPIVDRLLDRHVW